jgi:hypothetical protein
MIVPTVFVGIAFIVLEIPVMNSNTGIYRVVLTSYLHPTAVSLRVLARLPLVFFEVFFLSNFVFIPALLLLILVAWKRDVTRLFAPPELALIGSVLMFFIFNNAAPDYGGWQMRGAWISRIYQPVIAAFLMVVARAVEQDRRARWSASVAITAVLNFSIVLGALTMNPLASQIYHGFYGHGKPDALLTNMKRFGRRPLGFCSGSHALDEFMRAQSAAWRLPDYAFRGGKGRQ